MKSWMVWYKIAVRSLFFSISALLMLAQPRHCRTYGDLWAATIVELQGLHFFHPRPFSYRVFIYSTSILIVFFVTVLWTCITRGRKFKEPCYRQSTDIERVINSWMALEFLTRARLRFSELQLLRLGDGSLRPFMSRWNQSYTRNAWNYTGRSSVNMLAIVISGASRVEDAPNGLVRAAAVQLGSIHLSQPWQAIVGSWIEKLIGNCTAARSLVE